MGFDAAVACDTAATCAVYYYLFHDNDSARTETHPMKNTLYCATCGLSGADYELLQDMLAFEDIKAFDGYMPRKLAMTRAEEDIQRLETLGLITRGCWGQCDRMRGMKLTPKGQRVIRMWQEDIEAFAGPRQ